MKKLFTNYKPIVWVVMITFLFNTICSQPVQADVPFLPTPGQMVNLTPSFAPSMILGLKVFKDNPFKFEFVISQGDMTPSEMKNENSLARKIFLKEEANRLVKYFLASLTIPANDMWVNLSPYEKNRIIPTEFGITEMGKELLAQDYLLKQVTASVMYPEGNAGKEFWRRIYQEAYKRFGTTSIPVNTFNKVWIVPAQADIYENAVNSTAVIIKSRLKVMLEEDYLALTNSTKNEGAEKYSDKSRQLSNELIRQVILPLLEKEVNTGKNFAVLRQVYNSLILAFWFKNKLQQSLISKGYVDRAKTNGIDVKDKNVDQEIYAQYLKAYKIGVYNYIKEEVSPENEIIPRKYFSGGIVLFGKQMEGAFKVRKGTAAAMKAKEVILPAVLVAAGLSFLGGAGAKAAEITPPDQNNPKADQGDLKKTFSHEFLLSVARKINQDSNGVIRWDDLKQDPKLLGIKEQIALGDLVINPDGSYRLDATKARIWFEHHNFKHPGGLTNILIRDRFQHIKEMKGKVTPPSSNIEERSRSVAPAPAPAPESLKPIAPASSGAVIPSKPVTQRKSIIPARPDFPSEPVLLKKGPAPAPNPEVNTVTTPQEPVSLIDKAKRGAGVLGGEFDEQGYPKAHAAKLDEQGIPIAERVVEPAPAPAPVEKPISNPIVNGLPGNVIPPAAPPLAPDKDEQKSLSDIFNGLLPENPDIFDKEDQAQDWHNSLNWKALHEELLRKDAPYIAVVSTSRKDTHFVMRRFSKWLGDGSGHDPESFIDFVYNSGFDRNGQPNVTFEVRVAPGPSSGKVDIAKFDEWDKIDNPEAIDQRQLDRKNIYVRVNWVGQDGTPQSGIVVASNKTALITQYVMMQAMADRDINRKLMSILRTPDYKKQVDMQAKLFGLPLDRNDDQPGNILVGAIVQRDQFGLITKVLRYIHARDVGTRVDHIPDGSGNFEVMTIATNGKNPQPIKPWTFDATNVVGIASFYTQGELQRLADPDTAAASFNTYLVRDGPIMERGNIIFGENLALKNLITVKASESVAEYNRIATKQYKTYLDRKIKLDLLLTIGSSALSWTKLDLPVMAAGDMLFDLWEQPERIGRYVPTREELQKLFNDYNATQPPVDQIKLVKDKDGKDSLQTAKGFYTDDDMTKLNAYLIKLNSNKAAFFILNQVSLAAEIYSNYLPSKNVLIPNTGSWYNAQGQLVAAPHGPAVNSNAPNSNKYTQQWYKYSAPRSQALYDVLSQRYVSFAGELNIPNVVSLLAQRKALPYVPLNQMAGSASFISKLFSILGVTVDLKSLVNQATGGKVFPLASGVTRFNFYILGFPLSLKSDKDLVDNIDIILNDDVSDVYFVRDGHLVSGALSMGRDEFNKLNKTVASIPIGKISKMGVDGHPMEVPVYKVTITHPDGKTTEEMAIFTKKALQERGMDALRDLKRYQGYTTALNEGGVVVLYGPNGGTLYQNIWNGLYEAYSQQGLIEFPSAYTFDQGQTDIFNIRMGNFEAVDRNLDFFNGVMEAQMKQSVPVKLGGLIPLGRFQLGPFEGIGKSYNVRNGEAVDGPDVAGTGMIALAIMTREHVLSNLSAEDKLKYNITNEVILKYHKLLVESIKWLQDVQNKQHVNNGALPNTPGGTGRYTDPNSVAHAALNTYGKYYNDRNASKAANRLHQWIAGLWDANNNLIKLGENENSFSADAQTRAFLSFGAEDFINTFYKNRPQDLIKFIKAIESNFGVDVINRHSYPGKTVHLIDRADKYNASRRLTNMKTTEILRIGFPEDTAAFVQVLKESLPYLTGKDARYAQNLISRYSRELAGMADKDGNLPPATELNEDIGFHDGRTAIGRFGLASGVQYQLSVPLGVNNLNPFGKYHGNNLGLVPSRVRPPANQLSYRFLNEGPMVIPGKEGYLSWHRSLSHMIEVNDGRLIYHDPLNNLKVAYHDQKLGATALVNMMPPPAFIAEEVKLAGENVQMSNGMNESERGQGQHPDGGVILQTPDGRRIGLTRGVSGNDGTVSILAFPEADPEHGAAILDKLLKRGVLLPSEDSPETEVRLNPKITEEDIKKIVAEEGIDLSKVEPVFQEFQNDALLDLLRAVAKLPQQEQSFINFKRHNNFLLRHYKVDGVYRDVIANAVFPLHKAVAVDVRDSYGVVTTSIFEDGLIRFIVTDQMTTVFHYDDGPKGTGNETKTVTYANEPGGRKAMVKLLVDKKSLDERHDYFNGKTPTEETSVIWADYIDPTLVSMDNIDPNKIILIKRAINYETGKISTQAYGLFTRPVWEADQYTVTDNHFDKLGRFTHSEQYQNIGTVADPKKGPLLFVNTAVYMRDGKVYPITDQTGNLYDQGYKTTVHQKDVLHDTDKMMQFDNRNFGRKILEYTTDSFRNILDHDFTFKTLTTFQYDSNFYGGQVPKSANEINAKTGKIDKKIATVRLDKNTQQSIVKETFVRSGKETQKTIEPVYGQTLNETRTDTLGRLIVIDNVYSDPLHVSSTTNIDGKLAVEATGDYNRESHRWTLEQTRYNYYKDTTTRYTQEKAHSVLSAGGHLIFENTIFDDKGQKQYEVNDQLYTEENRQYIPEYDIDNNFSRITERVWRDGKFVPQQYTDYSNYGDFFVAQTSKTFRSITENGKERVVPYTSGELLPGTEQKYWADVNAGKVGELKIELTSDVYLDKWIETSDRDGYAISKSVQVRDDKNNIIRDAQGRPVGERVINFDRKSFNVQNTPTKSTTVILQNGNVIGFATSTDVTTLKEAKLGLMRTQITNQINGLDSQELKDRRGRVIENPIGKVVNNEFKALRKIVLYNFTDFDNAHDSFTKSLLSEDGVNYDWRIYTKSELLSSYDEIIANHAIRFKVTNEFLSTPQNTILWHEVKDHQGHVIELDKGHMIGNDFNVTRRVRSEFKGIPGLIDVANHTYTMMVVNGKEIILTDSSDLMTAHNGVLINNDNVNTVPVEDIFNAVHRVRYQGNRHFQVIGQQSSGDQAYQEARNNLGNVEISLFGSLDNGIFNSNRTEYRVYETEGKNKYGNFDIPTSTLATVGSAGHEIPTSYSNNTNITTVDRQLVYKTQKGLGVEPGLTLTINGISFPKGIDLTDNIYDNHQAIEAYIKATGHRVKLQHLVEPLTQIKDEEGRVKITLTGYDSINPDSGFGEGAPMFVDINDYEEDLVTQPFAHESHTYFWDDGMGDQILKTDTSSIGAFIKNQQSKLVNKVLPVNITTLDGLTFHDGLGTYKVEDKREIGMKEASLNLDGTISNLYYEGTGVENQGAKKFKLYMDNFELPSYGMNLTHGTEEPHALYRKTLFDFNGKPMVLIDEFLFPKKDDNGNLILPSNKIHSSTLTSYGTIRYVQGESSYIFGSSIRTTPWSSIVSSQDIQRNGIAGKSLDILHSAGELVHLLSPKDADAVLNYGRQEQELQQQGLKTNGSLTYIEPNASTKDFNHNTWWDDIKNDIKDTTKTTGWLFGLVAALFAIISSIRFLAFALPSKILPWKHRPNANGEDNDAAMSVNFMDFGFTPTQNDIILDERFNNGGFKNYEDFRTRLYTKLSNAHKLSEIESRKKRTQKIFEKAMKRVSKLEFKIEKNAFTKEDKDRLSATTSVNDFMEGLKKLYDIKPPTKGKDGNVVEDPREASYQSALKMFSKYLTSQQLRAIIDSQHFQSLVGTYTQQRAVEVILKLMFKEIRDKKGYKDAIRARVDSLIRDTGLGKEFPDQIYALRDTFLKNIENARLLPEGFQFHDFDINTDLLAYSWDDLHKSPDLERQVRSNLVSVEKLFVFQVIFQRALLGLAGQGRAEEYLWAKYVYPKISNEEGLRNSNILGTIKAFKQVFHVLMLDEIQGRWEDNRDPKGKVKYFQNIITEEVYNDAFRYLIGQKTPSINDASWYLPEDVKADVAPLRNRFEEILESIDTVIGRLPDQERAEAVQSIADQLKPVMKAFVAVVDDKIKMPIVKNRLAFWQLTVLPLMKLMFNGDLRRRIFTTGGPYNKTRHDMVRRLNHFAILGSVSTLFAYLGFNAVSLLPFTALPGFIVLPWGILAAGVVALVSLVFVPLIKKHLLKSLNAKLQLASKNMVPEEKKDQNQKAIKSLRTKLKWLYGLQAGLMVGALVLIPALMPGVAPVLAHLIPWFSGLPWLLAHPFMIPNFIQWAVHIIPMLVFIETWRLTFYSMNYFLGGLALHNFYITNNVYEINNNTKTDKIKGKLLMSLFTDQTPAIGKFYKTRGQERLDSFINNVEEMTSKEDGNYFASDKAADNTHLLTEVLKDITNRLVSSTEAIDPQVVEKLNKEIDHFVDEVKQQVVAVSTDSNKDVYVAQRFKNGVLNKISKFFTGEERPGLQRLIDYVNHNYRLDKGTDPLSWEHVLPTTVAILGYGEDWYFNDNDLLDVKRGDIAKKDIINAVTNGKDVLDELVKMGVLLEIENGPGTDLRLNPKLKLDEERAKELLEEAGITKTEDPDGKLLRILQQAYESMHETQEFTHRLGMLAKYKTELFIQMVNRLEGIKPNERNDLLKMIDDPTYRPEGIEGWDCWKDIREWANLQLPTGYANAVTNLRTLKRVYTHYARMFGEENPEAAALDKFRVIDRNLGAIDALSKVFTRSVSKSTFEKEFSNGGDIYDWLVKEGYFYQKLKDDNYPKVLSPEQIMTLGQFNEEADPHKADRILAILNEASKDKLREIVDVLIETNYKDTYKNGRGIPKKDIYELIKNNQPKVILAGEANKYSVIMLNKLMDLIINKRLFPARVLGGGISKDKLNSENYHGAKYNQKTAILPFLIGPVLLNLDADHAVDYVGYEFLPNHLLEFNYWPGLAVTTPVIRHDLTKNLGVFGNILPVGENAFYFHSLLAKELFGGSTATGKLFELISAVRHSEGLTDSYVAEDALTALVYAIFGYVTGRAGSVIIKKGWPFSLNAASNPTRKWSYDSVESVTGRVPMKMLTSPFTAWPYLVNNFLLDGFGFFHKKPLLVRYARWLIAFYLILDWNLFNNIPMFLWFGSLLLSQAISGGLFFYKMNDEGRGTIKGFNSAVVHILTKMFPYFVYQIFVFNETVGKLAVKRLGRFIQTQAKSANQTRLFNKTLVYLRSSPAIKTASILVLVSAIFVGLSFGKAVLWITTIFMGVAGVSAPFLFNPVRTDNRWKDRWDNIWDIIKSPFLGVQDVIESVLYGFNMPYGKNAEDALQIKVLHMINVKIGKPFGDIPVNDRGSTPTKKLFTDAFGPEQGLAVLEMTEYLQLFHQNPNHYRDMYVRPVLPVIFKLLEALAQKTDDMTDYTKPLTALNELGSYREALAGIFSLSRFSDIKEPKFKGSKFDPKNEDGEGVWESISPNLVRLKPNAVFTESEVYKIAGKDVNKIWLILQQAKNNRLSEVEQFLEALKLVDDLKETIAEAESKQLKEVKAIFAEENPTESQLDRADWLLKELSRLPMKIETKHKIRNKIFDTLFGIIGVEASLQALAIYVVLPLQTIFWDHVFFRNKIKRDYKTALKTPKSTAPFEARWTGKSGITANPKSTTGSSNSAMLILNHIPVNHIRLERAVTDAFHSAVDTMAQAIFNFGWGPKHEVVYNGINKTNGGIDLGKTLVNVTSSGGQMIQTAFDDPAMLHLLLNSNGVAPIIYNVRTMTPVMADHFVGLN